MLKSRGFTYVAPALAAGLLLMAVGCATSNSPVGANAGNVRFMLSSGAAASAGAPSITTNDSSGDREGGPGSFFQSASVTFSSVLARNDQGVLVNVTMDLPTTVDLVSLENGKQVQLPDGDLPAGNYDQLVVVMTEVKGVTLDGTTITIDPPGGGWTAIVPVCPFSVAEGGPTTVSLSFMVRQAFSWHQGRYFFQPRMQCGDATSS
jgi:Domain of unknown function (DUF4382)